MIKNVIRTLYHLLIIVSIGSSGLYSIVWNAINITPKDRVISIIRITLGVIALVFSILNLYNIKITQK